MLNDTGFSANLRSTYRLKHQYNNPSNQNSGFATPSNTQSYTEETKRGNDTESEIGAMRWRKESLEEKLNSLYNDKQGDSIPEVPEKRIAKKKNSRYKGNPRTIILSKR